MIRTLLDKITSTPGKELTMEEEEDLVKNVGAISFDGEWRYDLFPVSAAYPPRFSAAGADTVGQMHVL